MAHLIDCVSMDEDTALGHDMKSGRSNRKCRGRQGAGLVEAAASIVLLLPLFLVLLGVAAQVVQAYMIKSALTSACHQAVRQMTIQYWQNNQIAVSRSLQDVLVYNNLRIKNIIANSAQFSDADFDLTSDPPVVTVTTTYTSGKYGLPVYPNPDFLNIGSRFVISSTETHALE